MTSASDRLAGERLDYLAGSLADAAPADPLALCDAWLQDAFARRDLRIFNETEPLQAALLAVRNQKTVFLLMSSGNFGGIVFEELGKKLLGR